MRRRHLPIDPNPESAIRDPQSPRPLTARRYPRHLSTPTLALILLLVGGSHPTEKPHITRILAPSTNAAGLQEAPDFHVRVYPKYLLVTGSPEQARADPKTYPWIVSMQASRCLRLQSPTRR